MIILWILNTVTEQISNSLNSVHSASDLWLEMHERYAQIHIISHLANYISQLKQHDLQLRCITNIMKALQD